MSNYQLIMINIYVENMIYLLLTGNSTIRLFAPSTFLNEHLKESKKKNKMNTFKSRNITK